MSKHNPFDVNDVFDNDRAQITYDDADYTVSEAEMLLSWLNNDEAVALFNRYLDSVRQTSVDMMDAGIVTMANSEELVRQSAMRQLIYKIKTMRDDITGQLQAIAQSKTDV